MIKIKILKSNSMFSEEMKTIECPKCKTFVNSWAYPVMICRQCNKKLVNINNLIVFDTARVAYHKKGEY